MSEKDVLISAVGVDYTKLRDLLMSNEWQKADKETGTLMLKIACRVDAGWLREEDITKFPCPDLETIDQLWLKYSQKRFGFSVQSGIWENVGKDYTKFSDAVGWRLDHIWRQYSQLTFSLEAPTGHLPAAPFFKPDDLAIGWAATMTSKLAECYAVEF